MERSPSHSLDNEDAMVDTSGQSSTVDVTSRVDESGQDNCEKMEGPSVVLSTEPSAETCPSDEPNEEGGSEPQDEDDIDVDDLVVQDEYDDDLEPEGKNFRRRCKSESGEKRKNGPYQLTRTHSASPYKYKRPDPVICGEAVEIEAVMHKAQFFLARACKENVQIAKERSIWTTSRRVEKLLCDAFNKAPTVILIFIEKGADYFSGFAKVVSQALYRGQPAIRWKDFHGGGNIKIQWISRCHLDTAATKHIKNPFNKEREVFIGADGSEIQRYAGQRLCSLFPIDEGINLSALRPGKARKKIRRKRSRIAQPSRISRSIPRESLPSLLDTRISYGQFKRARRDVKRSERLDNWGRSELDYLYSHAQPLDYDILSRRELTFDDYILRPLPLMELPVLLPSRSHHEVFHERIHSPGTVVHYRSRSRSPRPLRVCSRTQIFRRGDERKHHSDYSDRSTRRNSPWKVERVSSPRRVERSHSPRRIERHSTRRIEQSHSPRRAERNRSPSRGRSHSLRRAERIQSLKRAERGHLYASKDEKRRGMSSREHNGDRMERGHDRRKIRR